MSGAERDDSPRFNTTPQELQCRRPGSPAAHRISPNEQQGGTWDVFFWVSDIRALHAELVANGADVVYGPTLQEAYHMTELAARDADGYVLGFGEPVTD